MTRFIRFNEVQKRSGLPRSSIYEQIEAGTFPKPVKLGPRAVGFSEREYEEWAEARLAARGAA